MEKQTKKVFAFDLDGTLTEHRTWITEENLAILNTLREQGFRLIVVGAGQIRRIHNQLLEYPLDIIGNYGLQYAVHRDDSGILEVVRDAMLECDRESVRKRVNMLRKKLGFTEYEGDTVEFHPSGCVTFPVLGTRAPIADKLVFDADRSKRCEVYDEVAAAFPEYTVFVGGSTSFDMVPMPYNKYYALDLFCREEGYSHEEITYFGDEYGKGGNDEVVFRSDIDCVKVDDYRNLSEIVDGYLKTL